jgi:hypothetical protein
VCNPKQRRTLILQEPRLAEERVCHQGDKTVICHVDWPTQLFVCVIITAGPSTKLFACGGGDMGGHVLRETLLFISAVPNTKLCAWGEEDSGGHVL